MVRNELMREIVCVRNVFLDILGCYDVLKVDLDVHAVLYHDDDAANT